MDLHKSAELGHSHVSISLSLSVSSVNSAPQHPLDSEKTWISWLCCSGLASWTEVFPRTDLVRQLQENRLVWLTAFHQGLTCLSLKQNIQVNHTINDEETSTLASLPPLHISLCERKTCGFASVAAENMCVKSSARWNHILQLCPNKTGQSQMVSSYEETDRKWGWERWGELWWAGGGGMGCLWQLILSFVCCWLESCQIEYEVQQHNKCALTFDPLGQPPTTSGSLLKHKKFQIKHARRY